MLQLQLFTIAGMCRGVVHVEFLRVSLCHGQFLCFGSPVNPEADFLRKDLRATSWRKMVN
jgi:hypothetical protein